MNNPERDEDARTAFQGKSSSFTVQTFYNLGYINCHNLTKSERFLSTLNQQILILGGGYYK